MKTRHKIIATSILIGFGVWLVDAALDYYVFYEGSFWDLLILKIPQHEVYIRVMAVTVFTLFGLYVARLVDRLERSGATGATLDRPADLAGAKRRLRW